MKDEREDFSLKDIRTLWQRVGGKCSNPNCRKETVGPNTDPGKGVLVGQAAHIVGACPNSGPRHDSTLPKGERKKIENGIWLCNNCARLIDVDEKKYTVELLKKWKEEAEQEQYELVSGASNKKTQNDEEQQAKQELFSTVNKLHDIYTYALNYYKMNFNGKNKDEIQNEIEKYRLLHQSAIIYINKFQTELNNLNGLYNSKGLYFSQELCDEIIKYKDCFSFSFSTDENCIYNDFFGSLFISFLEGEKKEKETYNKINELVRNFN